MRDTDKKSIVEPETATVDLGEAVDPFERIQHQKAPVPGGVAAATAGDRMQAVVKKWSKISPKIFLLGCGGFFLLFLLLVYIGLYAAIQSSSFLQSVGLAIDDVKSILTIFAVLFFGIIFFGWFYMLVLNVYRAVTVKTRKLPYILWLIGWLVIIITTIVAGTLSISKIRSLGSKSKVITNMLVLPYVETKDKAVRVNEGIPVIAPLKMKFQLNKEQVDRNILPALGNNTQLTSFDVDCGNGQKLSATQQIYLGQTNNFFPDYCLYLTKGNYPISLTVNYLDRNSGEAQSRNFPVGDFAIGAEIKMEPQDDEAKLNDQRNEYIIGTAPVSVKVRAQLLFTDLKLKDDRILWDFNADGQPDIVDNAAFEYPFGRSQLYPIYYKLPGVNGYSNVWFTFDLRVLESELAQCTLDIKPRDTDRQYSREPKFDELIQVSSYQYTIVDTAADSVIDKFKEGKASFTYTFPKGGRYEIQTSYLTPEGQKGSCRTEPLTVGFVGNQVAFDLRRAKDDTTPLVKVTDTTPVTFDPVANSIAVHLLPARLELTVTAVQPDPTAKVQLWYDGKQLFEERPKVFEVPITVLWKKELKFVITTAEGDLSEQPYEVVVSRKSVQALIEATPMVGDDPLEVTLDASVSPLYNEKDEIVYFTRDFGDWQSKSNLSQGKITHVYRFDETKDNGQYIPSVTVKTRLGETDTYTLPTPIVVKKKQRTATISIDSHPTQQVKAGEIVNFSVATDGQVTQINRDFGNEQVVGCDDRACASTSSQYTKPGEYTISAEIQYANDVPVKARARIRVY